MAADIYEYTDARGRKHRVDDISKVPRDRLQHMLVIGGEDEAAAGATTASTEKAAPLAAGAKSEIPMDVWAVSAFLLMVGIFNKRFMLRVFCIAMAFIWVLYNGYDVFMGSELARTAEKKPKRASAAKQAPSEE